MTDQLRPAIRSLVRRPGFSLVVVATIAIGIGANTSIFSLVNAVLLEPLPVQEPHRLIRPDVRMIGGGEFLISTSIPNYRDWRDRNRTLTGIALNASRSFTLTGGDRPAVVAGRLILGPFFEVLGVPPARGRTLTAAETDRGAPAAIVVSHRFATRRLDPADDPIGQTVTLDGEVFTIVGVMPPSFTFPTPEAELFLPMGYFANRLCWDDRGCSQGSWAVGRLKDGVTLAAAQADFDRVRQEMVELAGPRVAKPELHGYVEQSVGPTRTPLLVMMGAVGFVLLIACANVASLVLARGEARRREIAVRAALGASRGAIVRNLMIESAILSVAGGALGLGLARLGIELLVPLVAAELPAIAAERIGINLPVALFAIAAAVASGVGFGLVPAWRSARTAQDDLRHGARAIGGVSRQRLRSALVVAEVAMSLVLLCGAGLLIKSVGNLRQVDKGFDGRNVLTARVPLPAARYGNRDRVLAFHDRLLERAAVIPGVEHAAIANTVPLAGSSWENSLVKEGDDPAVPENALSVQFHMVTLDYFAALGIPLLAGRLLTDQDRDGGLPVTVVDETMAKRLWPNEDPLGKRVTWEKRPPAPGTTEPIPVYRTVVGVVKNVRHYELESPARIQAYVAAHQSGQSWSRVMTVILATRADPRAATEPLRRLVEELDPDVALDGVETMEGYFESALGGTRVVGDILAIFSGLAAGLAGLGLFGLLAYTVTQRVREIGVRVALGAGVGQVVGLVARQGLSLTAVGIVIGLVAALGLTRLLQGLLFEVRPFDPTVFAITAAGCLVVALAASWVPARRAARTDPAVVLREE